VDARPTPEQIELDMASIRLGEKLGVTAVGDLDDRDRRARLESALVQAGWRELRSGTPDEPWASGVEAALVTRRLSQFAADVAFIGPVIAHDALRRCSVEISAPTLAVSLDLRQGGGGLAVDAGGAEVAVAVEPDGTVSTYDLTGIEPVEAVDLTRVVLPLTSARTTTVGHLDPDAYTRWEALAVTLTAADLVGAMEGAFTLANEYAKDRRQYGAPIGSFQAVQHMLAESKSYIEGAYSTMIHAAWAVDALDANEARSAAAAAKAYAGRMARTVCETAIQIHGGIGNTWECLEHVFLRRVLLSTALLGDDVAQLSYLAQQRWGASVGLS
jgi:hypothetical protein